MDVVTNITEFSTKDKYAITIGKFDGIHIGHQKLIEKLLCKQKEGYKIAVFTFDKSPSSFFLGQEEGTLTTREEKIRIFDSLNVDTYFEYELTKESASIEPEVFIKDILCKKINMKYIVAGSDLSFGKKGLGNVETIKVMSTKMDYEYEIEDKVLVGGEIVSSTLIRNYVNQGCMEKVRNLLGVYYAFSGDVMTGKKLGRTIGFPTINLEVDELKVKPPFGVYFTEVSVDSKHLYGLTNVGINPTVKDDSRVVVETHILDFNEDIYGKKATVKLLHFHRKEQKFENVIKLKEQIGKDLHDCRKFFEKRIQ